MKRWLLGIVGIIFILSGVASAGGPSFSGGGSGGAVITASDCDVAAYYAIGKLCQDTDDGKLYKGTGSGVTEIAAGSSGDFLADGSVPMTGTLQLGTNSITGTGSLGATGAGKLTKLWAIDLELTNAPTINGAAWTTILQAKDTDLDIYASITPSADIQTLLAAADNAAALTALGSWGISGSITDEQLVCSETTGGTNLLKSCGAKTTYTEPAANTLLMATGTGTTGGSGLIKGTMTNGYLCTYTTTGTLLDCNTDPATLGDVTDVGNCSSGNCLDGTSDGGTQILFYDAQGATTLAVGDNSGAVTVTLPTVTSTLAILGANTFSASQTITGDILPEAANTRAIGSTSAEWADIYLGDGAIIYGQNDQSNTITSSATGWSFAKPITIADVTNDNYIKITNNSGGRAPTASVYEIYPDAGVWKVNQNGTESSVPIGPTAGQVTFSGPTQARTVTLPDAAVTIPANPIGGTLGATTNVIPKASGTGTATLQASGITEDGTSASFGALNLVTTGSIQAGIKISSDANGMSSSEMTAVGLYGTMFFATGAGTWALPTAATGMSFCVYSTTAAAIVINPDDSDDITLNGTLLADGDSITSASGAGDFICMVAIDATHWYTLSRSGTWTDTN